MVQKLLHVKLSKKYLVGFLGALGLLSAPLFEQRALATNESADPWPGTDASSNINNKGPVNVAEDSWPVQESAQGFSRKATYTADKISWIFGFAYDPKQDIYVSRNDAVQRVFGFIPFFDAAAMPLGMVMDDEVIVFDYNSTSYMVELWKGQYFSATGAEIGLYLHNKGRTWRSAAAQDEMLPMQFDLTKNGTKVFSRSEKTWWLTGFKNGVFSNPEELKLENIRITFKDQGMRDAFFKALVKLGYNINHDKIVLEGNSVGFNFTSPKSKQFWKEDQRKIPQKLNQKYTNIYNSIKKYIDARDDSPETIQKIIEVLDGK